MVCMSSLCPRPRRSRRESSELRESIVMTGVGDVEPSTTAPSGQADTRHQSLDQRNLIRTNVLNHSVTMKAVVNPAITQLCQENPTPGGSVLQILREFFSEMERIFFYFFILEALKRLYLNLRYRCWVVGCFPTLFSSRLTTIPCPTENREIPSEQCSW